MSKPTRSSRRLQYEGLERREMMAVTASLSTAGVLKITGTTKADTVKFFDANNSTVLAGINFWADNRINSITIDMGKGNDSISLDSIANSGWIPLSKSITITTKDTGTDVVHFAGGHDVTLSGKGHTLTVSPAGLVTLDGAVLSWSNPNQNNGNSNQNNSNNNSSGTTNWFDSHVVDSALRALGHNLYADGKIDRNDILALLRNAEDGSVIDATEFSDLKGIVANTTLYGTLDYVDQLAADVVNGSVANAKYQGTALGNLAAGSSSAQLEKLINKWFLGLDRPTAGGAYRLTAGQLFVGGASYSDIHQGYLGDCYFMSSLGETALKNPAAITSMFIANGDGTYTVKFYNAGHPQYVTVDSYLPTNSSGQLIYANPGTACNNAANELWTELAEKAYTQLNELGFVRPGLSGNGQNNFSAIEGGYIYAALGQITGQATTAFTATTASTSFQAFVTAYNQGKEIGF
ncbi:MAG TPA: C2 family cysteine protease, partial [Lacipirellulaceae bacterium]|nr:C2 family cysteine protease [Lacipirellulaceae bacterium]